MRVGGVLHADRNEIGWIYGHTICGAVLGEVMARHQRSGERRRWTGEHESTEMEWVGCS